MTISPRPAPEWRWTRLFIPTLRAAPVDALTAGHAVLMRAGFLRQKAGGAVARLALAQRSLRKIETVVRTVLEESGVQEIGLGGGGSVRNFIHSVRGELRSWKQLPQSWFTVGLRERAASRWGAGLIGLSPYMAVEAAALDLDGAARTIIATACRRILQHCGIEAGEADGVFFVESNAGDDLLARCPVSGYAAPLRLAASIPEPPMLSDPDDRKEPEEFYTPGQKTIAQLAAFTGLPETSLMKSVVVEVAGEPLLVLLRGDHQLSEAKLALACGTDEIRPATAEEIRQWFGADPGSLGPVGLRAVAIIADQALKGRRNMVAGANRNDHHLRFVTPPGPFHDVRQAAPGERSVPAGAPLEVSRIIEIASVVPAAWRHPVLVTDGNGSEVTPELCECAIDVDRLLSAAVECCCDKDGMVLPPAIAPFEVVITPVSIGDESQRAGSERLVRDCVEAGLDAIFDDRDERPGIKFKDHDLSGIPWRLTVGRKLAESGMVEVLNRRTKEVTDVPLSAASSWIRAKLHD